MKNIEIDSILVREGQNLSLFQVSDTYSVFGHFKNVQFQKKNLTMGKKSDCD